MKKIKVREIKATKEQREEKAKEKDAPTLDSLLKYIQKLEKRIEDLEKKK